MANTTATWNKGDTQPSLSAMAVNDTKVITGTKATSSAMRKIIAGRSGKRFNFASTGRKQHTVTRIA